MSCFGPCVPAKPVYPVEKPGGPSDRDAFPMMTLGTVTFQLASMP